MSVGKEKPQGAFRDDSQSHPHPTFKTRCRKELVTDQLFQGQEDHSSRSVGALPADRIHSLAPTHSLGFVDKIKLLGERGGWCWCRVPVSPRRLAAIIHRNEGNVGLCEHRSCPGSCSEPIGQKRTRAYVRGSLISLGLPSIPAQMLHVT